MLRFQSIGVYFHVSEVEINKGGSFLAETHSYYLSQFCFDSIYALFQRIRGRVRANRRPSIYWHFNIYSRFDFKQLWYSSM